MDVERSDMKHSIGEKIQVVVVLTFGTLMIAGILLAMQSKPYPFQAGLQIFPIAMLGIVVAFMGMFGFLNILCWRDEE
jgi:hydrogenase/urease accessory protein HupE